MRERTRPRIAPHWWLLAAVALLAASAVVPLSSPRLPGTLRLGVVDLDDPWLAERALQPLADHLGRAVRRSAEVVATAGRGDTSGVADVYLEVASRVADPAALLAWVRPLGHSGASERVLLLSRRESRSGGRLIVGDPGLAPSPEVLDEIRAAAGGPLELHFGRSVHAHDEAVVAFVHGAYDFALVRESAVNRARTRGILDDALHARRAVGSPVRALALVAGPTLSAPARRRLAEAALELEHLRLDQTHAAARAVLQGLERLEIAGFSPVTALPEPSGTSR